MIYYNYRGGIAMSELHSAASENYDLEHLHNCYAGYVGFCSEPKGPRQKGRSRVTLFCLSDFLASTC